jgi:hypothetical protein
MEARKNISTDEVISAGTHQNSFPLAASLPNSIPNLPPLGSLSSDDSPESTRSEDQKVVIGSELKLSSPQQTPVAPHKSHPVLTHR